MAVMYLNQVVAEQRCFLALATALELIKPVLRLRLKTTRRIHHQQLQYFHLDHYSLLDYYNSKHIDSIRLKHFLYQDTVHHPHSGIYRQTDHNIYSGGSRTRSHGRRCSHGRSEGCRRAVLHSRNRMLTRKSPCPRHRRCRSWPCSPGSDHTGPPHRPEDSECTDRFRCTRRSRLHTPCTAVCLRGHNRTMQSLCRKP